MILTTLKKRYFLIGILIFLSLIALSTRSGIMGAIGVAGVLVLIMFFSGYGQVRVHRYKKNMIFSYISITNGRGSNRIGQCYQRVSLSNHQI